MRLSPSEHERRRLRELSAVLGCWEEGAPSVLASVISEVGALISATAPLAYGLRLDRGGLRSAFFHSSSDALVRVRGELDAHLARRPVGWSNYNPFCPEPGQRNRAVHICDTGMPLSPVFDKYGIPIAHQLRVLLTDGPVLLAWVGGLRPDAFSSREIALLDALVPALHRRLLLERRLAIDSITAATLDVLLERVGGAAYVVSRRGAIVHANAAGWSKLGADGPATARAIADAVAGRGDGFDVTQLSGPGLPPEYLVVERAPDATDARVIEAARRWALTQRQTEILGRVARGHTNKRIAAELGLAQKTIEGHIKVLFDKASCETRAALVAAVWAAP